jgi:hypothetical protein
MDFHFIQHAIGFCSDSHSHFDLIDIMVMSSPEIIIAKNQIKYYLTALYSLITLK